MLRARRFLLKPNSSAPLQPRPVPSSPPPLLISASSSFTSLSTALRIDSTTAVPRRALSPFPPIILRTTVLASADRPALTSQRGLSGRPSISSACRSAGRAPRPTIHRQPSPRLPRPHPTRYATTWPSVMNMTLTVTRAPRQRRGAASAMYSGVTKLAAPTPAPTTARPTTMAPTDPASACAAAPTANSRSAPSITALRPARSASADDAGDAASASSDVALVIRDLSSVVSGRDSDGPMETKVAEMMPVSSGPGEWLALMGG